MTGAPLAPDPSPALLVQRAGAELGRLAADLRGLESACLSALLDVGRADPARLQAFDPLIQHLDALAQVLARLAPHLPRAPDPALPQILAGVRLARLTDALLAAASPPSVSAAPAAPVTPIAPSAPAGAEIF